MSSFKETLQRYDSAYLLQRRALGDELSEDAHATIEAILTERGEAVPPRPAAPILLDGSGRSRRVESLGKGAGQFLLVIVTMVFAKMLAHTWIGLVASVALILYFAYGWLRHWTLTPAQREARHQAKLVEQNGLTELMQSAADGDLTRVNDLLRYGVDVNARSGRGATALMYAARNNRLEIADALVAAGADVNVRSEGNSTALSIASRFGHQALADFLRQHGGVDPDPT
ncbi:ankyrin repeat domain-containing protein [Cupriavidus sp. WKF15]|uniref:ankyrin repeat domain-containing protein n=1 Tax=Cupriavidus sp. WKF15 TaxID=3032282 RepID=UPI0023E34B25|nr:ankyrin repeat domain-containing protein [Cupriavidus sp. WKF15]WER48608.1 ankyrin repeat domain-containing protein [Cupriavidus sp. WKF15]